jgi:hypothetical protein
MRRQGDAEASSRESAKEIVAANRLDADVRKTPATSMATFLARALNLIEAICWS